jgi:exonuclease SbcC
MTILTTASNLEELIDSKPTARGQVLSRFMGLDFLKRKEDVAKEIYTEFASSMISKVYNSEKLKQDNEDYKIKIQSFKDENTNHQNDLILVQDRIIKGQEYRDGLLKSKHTDIDKEITLLSPDKVTGEILSLETQKKGVQKQLEEIKVIEPSSYYHEDEHDLIKEETKKTFQQKVEVEIKIKSIEELKSSVSGGIKCEHCGIELMNAAITNSKISQLDGFIVHKTQLLGLMQDLTNKEQAFVQLKKEFDEYEKNKLIKEKHELNIESLDMKISNLQDKLSKYNELQDKIKENEKTETLIIKAGLKLDELESEKTNLSRKIDTNNFQIKSFDDKIENNNKLIQKISEESEKEKIYKVYLDIFGKNGISKIIMKTMMPLINSELQRLLEDSSHFRLEVRINDKNEVEFIMIDNNTQVEKLMASGSGYERTIASLALRSVLTKICSLPKPNIVVMDEVFGKISNDNLDMVGEFFNKIKEYFEKIFLITHNPLVTNWSDNVIKIKKVDNISFVTQ